MARGYSLVKSLFDLLLDILFEATQEEPLNVRRPITFRVRDGGGIEHVHQTSERLGAAVMGRGRS